MAVALQALRRSRPLLGLLPHPSPLSTSSLPPDVRELLRIDRILNCPSASQPQQHPRAATDLHQLLHRAAGLTAAESASLLRRLPGAHAHPHPRLGRLLHELAGLRLPGGEVKAALASDPEGLLSMDPGEPSRLLDLLRNLRCREAVRDQILAHGPLRAAVAARRRVELLRARGMTRHDALRVLAAEPRAMLYSTQDVERKVEYLVETMGFEVGWLVQYPEFLGVNLERWIIPRHNVVEHLKSVGGLGDPVEMKHYVTLTRRRFYNMFVKPYPECERIFGGLVRERSETARRRHPTGLWKLFKPAKHERTQEDVQNMKLLVGSLK
ncbi:transcription termination factor MTERF15, mitochondrial [Miscanthus floridulus]|uniref:transcription termination factor MTERF15, mitochondrial n=1 Tax=Miscanthus floridulus TaxID=154761 RepID=UPI003459A7FD